MPELWKLSASQIAKAVRSKQLSATEVTQAHLARLDQVNPAINAIVQEFPAEALAEARSIDDQIAKGQDPGPLAGVPVTIKVNVDQKGHATTNGLKLQQDLMAQHDSPVVSNLRKAGGVIIGRTNTPAFSLRWFTNNDLHGQTLNPRNAGLTPGGSSGGAASAVAAGICAIGHGTDIAGSVRYPAYACGLHGLRPSLGRVPAYNASGADRFIGGQLMAVSGPIARTIKDIELSLAALSAPDWQDPWYTPGPLDQGAYEKRAALTLAPDGMDVADEVRAALLGAAHKLEAAGWQVDEIDCPSMQQAARINAQLWMAEMQHAGAGKVTQEGEADSQFVFRQMMRDAGSVGIDDLMTALQSRASLIRQWAQFLTTYPLLICPVSGQLPFAQQQDVQSESAFETVFQAQLTQRALPTLGLPALSVATGQVGTGQVGTAPIGVQLVSGRYREDILLAAGAAIEAAGPPVTVADPF